MTRHPGGRTCNSSVLRAALLVIVVMLRHPVAMWRYVRTGAEPE